MLVFGVSKTNSFYTTVYNKFILWYTIYKIFLSEFKKQYKLRNSSKTQNKTILYEHIMNEVSYLTTTVIIISFITQS